MIWIEFEGKRTNVSNYAEAQRIILTLFPDARFQDAIQLDNQRVTHVRRGTSRTGSDLDLMPVAVIVEEYLAT